MSMQSLMGEPPPLLPLSWQQRVDLANSEVEVVAVAREFLAMFTPYELGRLPALCQPPLKLVDGDDVAAYAYDLVRHECADGSDAAELVHKLAAFFAHASMRIAQLSSRVQMNEGKRYSA